LDQRARTVAELHVAAAFDRSGAAPPADRARTVVVVAGLPRSGTSLMMQMLHAAGMPVMTDGERKADESNPRGYFEWEPIRKLRQHPEILREAEGRAIKVISMLLPWLPGWHRYKIVFMDRPIDEVSASHARMLVALGQPPAADPERTGLPPMAIAVLEDYHFLGQRLVYSALRASGYSLANYGHCEVDDLVARVIDGSPAFAAGIRDGDLLLKVEEEGLQDRVKITASFCFEKCAHGPTVEVDGKQIHHCTSHKASEAVQAKINAEKG